MSSSMILLLQVPHEWGQTVYVIVKLVLPLSIMSLVSSMLQHKTELGRSSRQGTEHGEYAFPLIQVSEGQAWITLHGIKSN